MLKIIIIKLKVLMLTEDKCKYALSINGFFSRNSQIMRYYKVLKVVVYMYTRTVLKYACIKYKCSVKILVLILSLGNQEKY